MTALTLKYIDLMVDSMDCTCQHLTCSYRGTQVNVFTHEQINHNYNTPPNALANSKLITSITIIPAI